MELVKRLCKEYYFLGKWYTSEFGSLVANAPDSDALDLGSSEHLLHWLQNLADETGFAGEIKPARDLVTGVTVESDIGEWQAYETPGHSPSHVCLFQPERRLLISGDHLLGRISLYFEYGNSPDPVGEFLHSLDVVEGLGARLCLPGHGRTFADVFAHIQANRRLVDERLATVLDALRGSEPTPFEVVPQVYGDALSQANAHWLLSKTLAYLTHLEALGRARRIPGEVERWTA